MTMTVTPPNTAAQTATPLATPPTAKAAAAKAAAQAPASTGTSAAQQQAALRQLLTRYAYDQSRGMDTAALAKLGRQITSAAKALGQHVTLPHAPATEVPATSKGKVDVTA